MKTNLWIVVAVLALAACSTPKYTYKFDYHDYNAGRKEKQAEKQAMKEVAANPGPVEVQPDMLVAEAPVTAPAEASKSIDAPAASKTAPLTLTKAEKKEMIKEYKAAVKQALKVRNLKDISEVDQSTKAMDRDLKLSLIFLIVAIVGGVLYSVSPTITYVVTTVAFILAVVFFIKWLMKQ